MKINLFLLLTLIYVNISFSQSLVTESDLQIQRFGKESYYKDKENNPLNGYYKIADGNGNYSDLIFKNGKKDGKSTDYDFQGRIKATATYKNGKYVGIYTSFHYNGKKQLIGNFIDGEKDGKWEWFDSKGKTTDIEHYKKGLKTGKWEAFDKTGKLRQVEYYVNDQKTGKWWSRKYYPQYETYSYVTEEYKNNQHIGEAQEKTENGALKWERKYINNRNYSHKDYFDNGNLALVYHLKEGKNDKERIRYNYDGTVLSKSIYKEGRLIKSVKNHKTTSKTKEFKTTRATNTDTELASIEKKITDFNYKALLISNANYLNDVANLDFPIVDAEKLSNVLLEDYSFAREDIVHLKDATRSEIINTLDSLADKITSKDNLLIFYAGHGVFDENLNKGYWIPVDATVDKKNNWVSNSDITDYITAIKSQHTLLISDACFSGSIFDFKHRELNPRGQSITEKLLNKRSRKAMTSGLNKTVPDESVFIKYLIKSLRENTKAYLRAGELYNDLREAVMANTDNNPQFEVIKNANHEGGEFIFLRKD